MKLIEFTRKLCAELKQVYLWLRTSDEISTTDKILVLFLALIGGMTFGTLMDNIIITVAGGMAAMILAIRAMMAFERALKRLKKLINAFA